MSNLRGALQILYLALFIVIAIFRHEQIVIKNAPTSTATIIPTPSILVHQPTKDSIILYEDFSSNRREWGLYYAYGKLEVINGKLILQSNVQRGPAVGKSQQFAPSSDTYYIQADLATDTDGPYVYGLIFGFNESLGSYYLFEIMPKAGYFRLLKYNNGKLHELVPHTRSIINPYPESNTLGVYFDIGDIELYMNGDLVSNFSDDDLFRSTGVGVFVNNDSHRLIVDNFFVSDEK